MTDTPASSIHSDNGGQLHEPPCPEGMRPSCPDDLASESPRGCGSTNVTWDGVEMWDCRDCGLFFTPEVVKWVGK